MATFNQARYRYIDWIAERILEASELDRLQQIMQGVAPDDVTRWAWDLGAIYKEGATFNVTPTVAGTTVTLTATNSAQPMLVFVRGRWEILQTTEAAPVTLATGQTNLYLNWQLVIVNNTVDPSLVDSGTGEPTAEMGQLVLEVAAADTSTTALNTSLYFQQNSGPIVLFTFAVASGTGVLTVVSSSGVKTQALASGAQAGMVSLTTTTSDGQALSSDDPSVTNTRNPNPLSVTDAAVRAPVLSGGSTQPIGTGAGQDPGGINTAKLVHVPTSQTGAAVIEAVRAQANATQAALAAHAPAPLGSGVHVMPTAAQVGAAPASHVGQVLGLSTSHPPEVDADSGGFEVLRDPGAAAAAMDPGFGILMANILQSGLLHNGDVYGILSQSHHCLSRRGGRRRRHDDNFPGFDERDRQRSGGTCQQGQPQEPAWDHVGGSRPLHYIRLCGEQRLHQVHDGNQLVHDPVGHRNDGQQCTWNILLLQSAVSEQLLWSVRYGRLH